MIPLIDPYFRFMTYAKEKNPFEAGALVTSKGHSDEATSPCSMWSDLSHATSSPFSASETRLLDTDVPTRLPVAKAHTFPKYKNESRVKVQEQQEAETTIFELVTSEEQGQTFRLKVPFIYATKTRNLPQYQLQRDFHSNGSASKLHIRAGRPRETRSYSVAAIHGLRGRQMQYNDKETLYSMDTFEMRCVKSGTLPGSIQMTCGKSLWGGQWTRIWHVTKCKAQHHVCDYRGACEPEKHILYCVKKGVWEDAEGLVVAREETGRLAASGANQLFVRTGAEIDGKEKAVVVTEEMERDGKKRDLVMACWVMKLWMAEQLRWEGD